MKKLLEKIFLGTSAKGEHISKHCGIKHTICPRSYLQACPENDIKTISKNIIMID